MRGFLKLTIVEMKLFLREPAAVFFTLAFPAMLLVIFGSIFGNDPADGFDGYGSVDLSVPGYIGMIIGTIALLSVPIVISEYRAKGIFRRLRATPINPAAIILAQAVIYYIMLMLGLAILFVLGKLLYGLMLPQKPFELFGVMTISYLAFSALGFVISSLFRSSRTASVVGNVIYFPQIFLSGAALPRELFSDRLRQWTEWLPMTQSIKILKQAWLGHDISMSGVVYVVVLGVISAVIASRVFKWE